MSALRVFVITSDKYNWALQPFAYLFQIYWSTLQPVIVCGYTKPSFLLPPNFQFFQIAPQNYPADHWSDGLLRVLSVHKDEHIVLLLEDYWLCRTVDLRGVQACHQYMIERPSVLRFDLTDDRQYNGHVKDVDMWGSYDIVETPNTSPYQMSLQGAIWNTRLLKSLLIPNKSAWEVEIHTQPPENMRVLGTRQKPLRYANAIHKGKLDVQQLQQIQTPHDRYISNMIPKDMEAKK